MMTIDDVIEDMKNAIEDELNATSLSEWSVASAGSDFRDVFNTLPSGDLRDLVQEIHEGLQMKVDLDLTDAVLAALEEILEQRGEEADDEEEEEDFDEEDE